MKVSCSILAIVALSATATMADPVFTLSTGPAAGGDVAWQTSVGGPIAEFDLDGFANGSAITTLTAGSLVITTAGESFHSSFAGGAYGTVFDGTLLNRVGGVGKLPATTFTFSEAVRGFGTWIFDNGAGTEDSFQMTVTDVDNNVYTSAVLESGNGTAHAVEGFIGVVADKLIKEVSIVHVGAVPQYFELDHIQVAAVPAPGAALLIGLGLAAIGWIKRRIA